MSYFVNNTERKFTPKEAEAVSGVSVTLQRDWRRRGLLPESEGAGWTVFHLDDVAAMLEMKLLSESGVPLKVAQEIASLSVLPILKWLSIHPENFEFTGDPIDEAMKEKLMGATAVGSDAQYLVVPLPYSDNLLFRCSRGDDLGKLINGERESATHYLVIDHRALAQRLMQATRGPIFTVHITETED